MEHTHEFAWFQIGSAGDLERGQLHSSHTTVQKAATVSGKR